MFYFDMIKKAYSLAMAAVLVSVVATCSKSISRKEAEEVTPHKYVTNTPAKAQVYTLTKWLTVILSPDIKGRVRVRWVESASPSPWKQQTATNTVCHYLVYMLFKEPYGSHRLAQRKVIAAQTLYKISTTRCQKTIYKKFCFWNRLLQNMLKPQTVRQNDVCNGSSDRRVLKFLNKRFIQMMF